MSNRVYTQQELELELLKERQHGFTERLNSFENRFDQRMNDFEHRFEKGLKDFERIMMASLDVEREHNRQINWKINGIMGVITLVILPTLLHVAHLV